MKFATENFNRNFAFILLFLLYFFDYADRMVVNSLFPSLRKEWQLTDTQCGMLVSVVYWSITLTTLPISILIDRWSRKNSIAIMAVMWSMFTAGCTLATNYTQLLFARIGIGIGEAGYAPGGMAMISALFTEKKRSFMMGIWNASIPFGAAAGIAAGGYIAQTYGWKHAFGIVAIPGLVISILFFFVKDYKTVSVTDAKSPSSGAFQEMKTFTSKSLQLLKTPSLLITYFGFAANTFVTTSLITWLPTYFKRIENISDNSAGLKGSAVMLSAIIGAPLGGFLADLWLKKYQNARPVFAGFSAILSGVVLISTFHFFSGSTQFVFLIIGALISVLYIPAAAAVTQDVVHPGFRAISFSLCVIVQNLIGSGLGPVVTGYTSDHYAKIYNDIVGIQIAMTLLPIMSIVSGILFLFSSKYYLRDLEKIEKIDLSWEK